MVKVTEGQIAKGFEEWERQAREDRGQFLSESEKAGLALEDYGQRSAKCLLRMMGERGS